MHGSQYLPRVSGVALPVQKIAMFTAIRTASAEDKELLTALHAEGFAHYWDASAFNDFFSVQGTRAFIVETIDENGKIPLGMLVLRVTHEQSDIITLAVRGDYRRHGIARMLLTRAIGEAVALGATHMFLDVEDGNSAALKLYEAFGFTQINRRKQYYRQKDGSYTDALVMARKLA